MIVISQVKLKISEHATGSYKHCEQWTFLPKNAWYSRMVLNERLTQFHKNFCLLYFYRGEFGPGHFLLMNLVTRVQFWVERDEIEESMKEEFPNFNFDDEIHVGSNLGALIVESDKIVVPYQFGGEFADQVLGEY